MIIFSIVGVFVFLVSLSTRNWNPVIAEISPKNIAFNNSRTTGPAGKPSLVESGTFVWYSADYQYTLKGQIYSKSLVCICLPIGLDPKPGTAYVSPWSDSVSVLVRGPHYFLSFVFLFFSSMCYALKKFLEPYAKRRITSQGSNTPSAQDSLSRAAA